MVAKDRGEQRFTFGYVPTGQNQCFHADYIYGLEKMKCAVEGIVEKGRANFISTHGSVRLVKVDTSSCEPSSNATHKSGQVVYSLIKCDIE